jgi:hypothetical protein
VKGILSILAGFFCLFFSAWNLLVIYAFASMMPSDIQGWERLSIIMGKMLDPQDALLGTLVLVAGVVGGLTLIVVGFKNVAAELGDKQISGRPADAQGDPSAGPWSFPSEDKPSQQIQVKRDESIQKQEQPWREPK